MCVHTVPPARFSGWLCFPGLILPDSLRFGNAAKLQKLVHIIGENMRYSEPFVADRERACQAGGSYKYSLYEAKRDYGTCRIRSQLGSVTLYN